jgi:hypothetical protein
MVAIHDIRKIHKDFVKQHGPSFVWGQVLSPYDGCFHLNVVAFIRGERAFVTADLKSFTGSARGINYAQYVVDAPEDLQDNPYFTAGCIHVSDITKVLRGEYEFRPLADLPANTPRALTGHVLEMASLLGYDCKGLFKCNICGSDFLSNAQDLSISENVCFLQSEFRGAGGIAIDVGDPVCEECYVNRRCGYCGEEVEPDCQAIDDNGHCIYCAPKVVCSICGESIDPRTSDFNKDAYQAKHCNDCHDLAVRAEAELEKYVAIDSHTASLF